MKFRRKIMLTSAASAAAMALAGWSAPALAQGDKPDDSGEEQEIVVTGSKLLTADQAAALPLRVIDEEEIRKQGSPPLLDLVRAMPETAGSIGNSNSSQAGKGQGYEGSESINLRGLGPDRNLVLMNGHRLPLVSGFFVNTRNIPASAIGRVEILKDAASTIYGSDAMTGVVNFITKRDFEGLEVGGDYTMIAGNGGDWRADATFGKVGSNWNLLVSGGYQKRAQLEVVDRDWSIQPYSINPNAGWNFSSMPSQFTPVGNTGPGGTLATVGPRVLDVGCKPLGGIEPFAGFCVNNVQKWQDLVAPAKTWQIYGEFNWEFSSGTEFHIEANYANARMIVHYPPSFNQPKPITATVLPSNMNTATALAGTSPLLYNNWFVPITNPGLAAYAAANPSQFPAGTTGIFIPVGQWRPYLVGGNPFFGDGATPAYQTRDQDEYRVSASLKGKMGSGINWNADFTYGRNDHDLLGFDSAGSMIQLALRGLGGPNCQWQTAAPGSAGCLWLNPMSNAVPNALVNGVTSYSGYNAAVANTKELADWLMLEQRRHLTGQIVEANAGLDGSLPAFDLGAGPLKWAVGAQWRQISFREHDSKYADRTQVPCLDSVLNIPNANICNPTPYSPLGLAVALVPTDSTTNVFAGFVEAVMPIVDGTDLTVGARYEDLGNSGGGTFNPQARAKVGIFEWLGLRGSVSTTFRAPPPSALAPNPVASIPGILGKPTALDTMGNPNLKPEEATTYNLGVLVNYAGFDAGVDYYNYSIKNILTTEPQNAIVNALFPNGAGGANNCATLDAQFIADHFEFTGACSAANLAKVKLLRINGPKAHFSGLDLRGSYTTDGVFGGTLSFGGTANVILSYKFDAFTVAGLSVAGFDAVGKLNQGTLAHALPKWKVNSFVNYNNGPFNLRWTGRYYSTYIDQRQATTTLGYKIPGKFLHDVALNVEMPWETTFSFTVTNLLDTDPPMALLAEGYDATTADLLGRTFRIGFRKKF
ncbi:TonB-dependent receptor plug domain-containing protein [Sphingomonas canadensis]|uniref:TonB-dependent receptor plug domain-containing protein n=1 Tax=Sphingomonas canadensis TaxID=1219257 RepID=A0ABW3HBX5_9SPHN|nr:TonB-dependent receptor [Sphingomonas canadensis]MCW3838354.1 TonB-dependent receptor [Sphingomonas canadensis]